jgi:predicted exporter
LRVLLYLPTDQVRAIAEHLRPMALLLEPPVIGLLDPLAGWRRLTLYEMTDKAALINGAFNPDTKENIDQDPLLKQLSSAVKKSLVYLDDPTKYESPWVNFLPVDTKQKDLMAEPFYFFSEDGTLAFLTTRATRDEKDGFTFAQKSVDRLREIVAEAREMHPEVRIGITGIPVLENDEMASTESDSNKAGWFALAGVLILYLAVYRTLRTPLL